MLHRLLIVVALILSTASAHAAERAAVIEVVRLADVDKTSGTAVSRGGQPTPPAVLMPLYEGDVIELKSPQSYLRIIRADNTPQDIRGPARVEISAVPAQGSFETFWWLWERIAGKTGEETPTNFASKGDAIVVPAGPAGGTILRDTDPVVLAWQGGKAPYWVIVGDARYKTEMARLDFAIPEGTGKRLQVEIKDEAGAFTRLTLSLTDKAPAIPEDLKSLPGSEEFRRTAMAAWLARQPKWRFEAMRRLAQLKDYEPANKLFDALAEGR
jgi:hypothetical protein